MRRLLYICTIAAALSSCTKKVIEEPENLIPEDKMVDIIYDLSLLEAIRTQRPMSIEKNNLDPRTYIYKKHKIDSVQFAQSNKYYAGDVGRYKRIYESVDKRIEAEKKQIEDQLKKSGHTPVSTADEPMVR